MTLSEIVQALDAQEFEVKLAAVEQAYQGDETRSQYFFQATEYVKEAEAKGEFGGSLGDSQFLSLCTQLVEEQIAEDMAKTASDNADDGTGEGLGDEELTKEAQEELYAYGQLAAEVLAENGITAEDLEKVASEEEAEALGRAAARLVAAKLEEE